MTDDEIVLNFKRHLTIMPDSGDVFFYGQPVLKLYFKFEDGRYKAYFAMFDRDDKQIFIDFLQEQITDIKGTLSWLLSVAFGRGYTNDPEPEICLYARIKPDIVISDQIIFVDHSAEFDAGEYVRLMDLSELCEKKP